MCSYRVTLDACVEDEDQDDPCFSINFTFDEGEDPEGRYSPDVSLSFEIKNMPHILLQCNLFLMYQYLNTSDTEKVIDFHEEHFSDAPNSLIEYMVAHAGAENVLEWIGQNDKHIYCFVAPSGSGKTTILDKLVSMGILLNPISCTTRIPRPGEVNGSDYFFVTKEKFADMEKTGEFLETSVYAGNHYGTLLSELRTKLQLGNVGVIRDMNGAVALKKHFPDTVIIYIDRNEDLLVAAIMQRDISRAEKEKRIGSLAEEKTNSAYADFVLDNNGTVDEAVHRFINMLEI
jgi:guanylate kinase